MTHEELLKNIIIDVEALTYRDDGEIYHGIQSDIVDRDKVLDILNAYLKNVKGGEYHGSTLLQGSL